MYAGIKLEFLHGSIVILNGMGLDEFNFKIRQDAPTFYGIVENPDHWDDKDVEEAQERESFVRFLLAGEYEWLDKNNENVLRGKFSDFVLTLIQYPPEIWKKSGLSASTTP